MNKLLIIFLGFMLFTSGKAQDTIQYLDTIYYKDLSKEAVNITDHSSELVEYNKKGSSSTHFLKLDQVDHIKLRDGLKLVWLNVEEQETNYKPKQPKPHKIDSIKRNHELLLHTNIASLVQFIPYEESIPNIGLTYFITTNFSSGIIFYGPSLSLKKNYPQFQLGGEINAGYLTNINRKYDIGIRIGVIFSYLEYGKFLQTNYQEYHQVSNWYDSDYTYNGKYYAFTRTTGTSTEQLTTKVRNLFDPYFTIEYYRFLSKKLSVIVGLGLKRTYSTYQYRNTYQTNEQDYNSFYNNNGSLAGTNLIPEIYYDYRPKGRNLTVPIIRLTFNYKIGINKHDKN